MGTRLNRLPDWQKNLNLVFDDYEYTDFQWGKSDCWCFVADCLKAMTGTDIISHIRGIYDTEEKAYEFLKNGTICNDNKYYNYKNEVGFFNQYLGKEKNIGGIFTGDVCLVKLPLVKNLIAGVVNDTGRYLYLQSFKDNLVEVPVNKAKHIWGI
jgi:hypothetical protein